MPDDDPAAPRSDSELLTAFLAEREAPCPACDYTLRGVKGVVCPECGERLWLTVGDGRSARGYGRGVWMLAAWPFLVGAYDVYWAATLYWSSGWMPTPGGGWSSGWSWHNWMNEGMKVAFMAGGAAALVVIWRAGRRPVAASARARMHTACWGLFVGYLLFAVLGTLIEMVAPLFV